MTTLILEAALNRASQLQFPHFAFSAIATTPLDEQWNWEAL